jgi:translation initiation factor 2 alpha subunit (eIF-2alpha)
MYEKEYPDVDELVVVMVRALSPPEHTHKL